ncbi:peptidylprolyl isomerase [Aquisalimonas sp.]|uniref:peptidylprolyl isomerase n=1 Tax=unclassified Aquisalimonas TaxID=2644645 RepID=UPI0025C3E1E9|nr:peptidylprolyl isomerase [Aquisalimonas sp.]
MNRAVRALYGLLLPMALLAAGCGDDTADEQHPDERQVHIVAKVNDEPISETMLQLHILRRTGENPDRIDREQRETLLLELVEMTLIAQDARERGLTENETVRAQMRNLQYAVLAQAMLEELKREPIPNDEMLVRFDQLMDEESQRQEYHARHILLTDEAEAEAIIEELDNGEDFGALAQRYSHGPTAARGGDLGWFVPGDMVRPFGEAVMELDVGEHTREPVRTRYGYHVIKLEGQRDREPPRFEDVSEQLRQALTQERIEDYVNELRHESRIELYRPQDED